jgi:hypothetical protein
VSLKTTLRENETTLFENLESSRSPRARLGLQMRMIAETYSTVGRSLPLTLLKVWEKYPERWGVEEGNEGFRMGMLP